MAWRVVAIENPARLSLRDNQLVIAQETEATLPIEDIDSLILDGYGITTTTNLRAALCQIGLRRVASSSSWSKYIRAASDSRLLVSPDLTSLIWVRRAASSSPIDRKTSAWLVILLMIICCHSCFLSGWLMASCWRETLAWRECCEYGRSTLAGKCFSSHIIVVVPLVASAASRFVVSCKSVRHVLIRASYHNAYVI
jgi:hypothetical protein